MSFLQRALKLQSDIQNLPNEDIGFENLDNKEQHSVRISNLIKNETEQDSIEIQERVLQEFEGCGPLESLLQDNSITEIIVNGVDQIWYERDGRLEKHSDQFASQITFENTIERICADAKVQFNIERPFCDGRYKNFRVHLISSEITKTSHALTLRRQATSPWTLEKLLQSNWCDTGAMETLRSWLSSHKNFLVIGETGCGKTSVLNSCLQELNANERVVVIEDTSEITIPNSVSTKLLSRQDCNGLLPEVSLTDLVKQSLRMRPDRLIVGEVRGGEAKDLLLALSTGHRGSMGTMHASNAHQALLRLEMLVQLGAPHWGLNTIRRLLSLSLDGIIVVGRNIHNQRKLKSLHQISCLEETGFLLDCVYESTDQFH